MTKKAICIWTLLLISIAGSGQSVVGLASAWNNRFDEWKVFYVIDSTEYEGEITRTYAFDKKYDDWSYQVEDLNGRYYKMSIGSPITYTLDGGSHDVQISPVWPQDKNEWRLSAEKRYTLKTKMVGSGDHWILYHGSEELLHVYTYYEGDVREWVVEDIAQDRLKLTVKLAALHTVLVTVLSSLKTQ